MIRTALKAIPLAAALMLATAPAAFAQNMVIHGGTIYTGDPAQPTAEQVIVRDGDAQTRKRKFARVSAARRGANLSVRPVADMHSILRCRRWRDPNEPQARGILRRRLSPTLPTRLADKQPDRSFHLAAAASLRLSKPQPRNRSRQVWASRLAQRGEEHTSSAVYLVPTA